MYLLNYGTPNLAKNVNFSDCRNVITTWIFSLTTNLKYKTWKKSNATFAIIIDIFGFSQVLGTFRLDSVLNVVFVVFGKYCLTLRAIISIIKRDNRLWSSVSESLNYCLSALCHLFSPQMPNSGRKISLNIYTFLKNFSSLYDVINTS